MPKGGVPYRVFGSHFGTILLQNRLKTRSENHRKIDTEKVEKMRPKSSQNGAKRGSKINEKLKAVFCLNSSNYYMKTYIFNKMAIRKLTKNLLKITLENVMQKTWKITKNGHEKGAKIHEKSENGVQKSMRKMMQKRRSRGRRCARRTCLKQPKYQQDRLYSKKTI